MISICYEINSVVALIIHADVRSRVKDLPRRSKPSTKERFPTERRISYSWEFKSAKICPKTMYYMSFRRNKVSCRVVNWNSHWREPWLQWILEQELGWALASWYSLCNDEVLRRLGFADYVYRIRISLEAPFNNSYSAHIPTVTRVREIGSQIL